MNINIILKLYYTNNFVVLHVKLQTKQEAQFEQRKKKKDTTKKKKKPLGLKLVLKSEEREKKKKKQDIMCFL